jgi:hypothetical protein
MLQIEGDPGKENYPGKAKKLIFAINNIYQYCSVTVGPDIDALNGGFMSVVIIEFVERHFTFCASL